MAGTVIPPVTPDDTHSRAAPREVASSAIANRLPQSLPLPSDSSWQEADDFDVPDEWWYNRQLEPINARPQSTGVTSSARPPLGVELGCRGLQESNKALIGTAPVSRAAWRDEASMKRPRASPLGLPPSSPSPPVAPIPPAAPPPIESPEPSPISSSTTNVTQGAVLGTQFPSVIPPGGIDNMRQGVVEQDLGGAPGPYSKIFDEPTKSLKCGKASRDQMASGSNSVGPDCCSASTHDGSPHVSPRSACSKTSLWKTGSEAKHAVTSWRVVEQCTFEMASSKNGTDGEMPCVEIDPPLSAEDISLARDMDGCQFEEDTPQDAFLKWLNSADLTSRSGEADIQLPYNHDVPSEHSSRARLRQILREASLAGVGSDGTVGPEPKSPPVVGRSLNLHFETHLIKGIAAVVSPSSVTMPRLQHVMVEQACNRSPWPLEDAMSPGLKAQAAEASVAETPSVFAFLRSHFMDLDEDNDRQICEAEFSAFVKDRTKRQCSWDDVPEDLEHLLKQSAVRCYGQAVVRDDRIRVEDWVHFGLLLNSSPSPIAHHLLNQRLRRELRRNPFLLKEILRAFEEADVRGGGVLRTKDIEAAFVNGHAYVNEMRVGNQDYVSYYDYVSFCLGYRGTEVKLNWYDVSNGFAEWVPPAILGGTRFEGVWHTGIVAFGKEYWYGGKVFSSEPGQAPFPPGPKKTTSLGTTLRTREELEDFLRFEMAPRYTRENYDVMRRNCNHFTDEVTTFLIQGAHIPDEARLQPEVLMKSPLLDGIRPHLNKWLGGFDASAGAEMDDLMTEWRARLWPGDLALYVPMTTVHEPLRLVRVSNVDAWHGICDISYFEADGPSVFSSMHRSQSSLDADVTKGSSSSKAATVASESTSIHRDRTRVRSRNAHGSNAEAGNDSGDDAAVPSDTEKLLKPLPKGFAARPGAVPRTTSGTDVRVLRLGSCVQSGSFWNWKLKHREGVPLSSLRPHTLGGKGLAGTAGAGLQHLARAGLKTTHPDLQKHLCRKAIIYAHCPRGHVMQPVQPEQKRRSWDRLVRSTLTCGICTRDISRSAESRLECCGCKFYLCSPCDRKGLFRGYYSLGSIDKSTATLMLQEPAWVRYKACRYMTAAGAGDELTLEIWHQKVAMRVYTDLGIEPPSHADVIDLYRRFSNEEQNGQWGGYGNLNCDQFTLLLMELLVANATVVTL